jgi:acetolactate synthase I/II/III large subunit
MADIKIAEAVADFLAKTGIRYVFGIIGSANAHLYDAIYCHPDLSLICLHHEQACVMAAHGYYMQSGRMAAVLVTAGAGTTNVLTGVVGAWADSVPVLIISGQESTKQFKGNNLARMIGIQGVYAESIYCSCTKSVVTCQSPERVISELAAAAHFARADRPGPCMVDIPIDLQAAKLDAGIVDNLVAEAKSYTQSSFSGVSQEAIAALITAINKSEAPLLWLGNGLRRLPGAEIRSMIEALGIPYLTSWSATDLFDPVDHLDAGHAGTYGARAGNLMLQSCDLLMTLGTRLAIPQKGYVDDELARRAEIFVVDCDQVELDKLSARFQHKYCADAPSVLCQLYSELASSDKLQIQPWLEHLRLLRDSLPLVEASHQSDQWVNSYPFMFELGDAASANTTFVTDMGTALISGFQVLRPRAGQRLFTSQGLGEMGYGLPGAIGAWFADPTRTVICLNCDGGLMMNLQELHSVISHEIPMKIVIFNNDGYLMIKHTQNAIVAGRRAGTDTASGLSCPNYDPLVRSFGFEYLSLCKEDDAACVIHDFLDADRPVVLEVFMDPQQLLVPKLSVSITAEGKLLSPPLEDLSPLISLSEIQRLLLAPIHQNSLALERGNIEAKGDAIY